MTVPDHVHRHAAGPAPGEHAYTFKPSLFGAAWQFHLAADALEWNVGSRRGRIAYHDIRRLRLSFRPVTMQTYRFLAEVWARDGHKVELASTSWRGMVEQERHDAAYSGFITELHRRIAAARTTAAFETGSSPLLYWPGLVIFVGVALGLAALAVRALQIEAWGGLAFVGGFLALFLWQAGTFFRRNRPGSYTPDALPADLLPKS